jgi:hypothetical protein
MSLSVEEMTTGVRSSDRKLLDCLCGALDPAIPSRLAQFSESDWEGVVASATNHGIRPLLYHQLTSLDSDVKIPGAVLEPLRQAFLVNGLRNTLLYQDLAKILEAFRQDDIAVIVLKGAHPGQLVYENIAARPMADIDLLVKPGDLTKVAATLAVLGYCCDVEMKNIHGWLEQHPTSAHLPPFSKGAHPRIEVHSKISHRQKSEDLEGFWQRARAAVIAEHETRVLSPEDLIVQLCLHTSQHSFSQGIRPLWDIAQTVRHYEKEMRWDKVQACASPWRAERYVYLSLLLSRKMTLAPVPDSALELLQPQGLETSLIDLAEEVVLEGERENAPLETAYGLSLLNACQTCRRSASHLETLKFSLRQLFPPREHMRKYMAQKHSLPLNPVRNYTCYLTRALDILGQYASAAVHRVTQGQSSDLSRQLRWKRWLDKTIP